MNRAPLLALLLLSCATGSGEVRRETLRFETLLSDLVEAEDHAFERTFGAPTEELDRAIYAYLKQGQYSQLRLRVPAAAPTAVKFEPAPEPKERLKRLEEQMKH